MRDAKTILRALYDAAVRRALPSELMARYLPLPPAGRTVVVGAGKAGGAMTQALEALWPVDAALSGLVVTRYGHIPPRNSVSKERIRIVEAAHPVPDSNSERAAREILTMVSGLGRDDLVICLISGGGSALLALPAQGVTLAQKQEINRALLRCGANIAEMNCVRKHLSAIKGGRLAVACAPSRVITLMISDVPGDDPAVIASGPTVPDASTCAQAVEILDRYRIGVDESLRLMLRDGALESPKPGDSQFAGNEYRLIATPRQSLEAAADAARSMGLAAHILADDMEGESRELGRTHAALARAVRRHGKPFAKPCVILSGGETTVTVGANAVGRGGRAGEFALGAAIDLKGESGITLIAADTDGIDGSEDNAGVLVTPDSLARAESRGLKAREYLARNDSYGFFSALGDLVVTGPTYTNVNDFRAFLIED